MAPSSYAYKRGDWVAQTRGRNAGRVGLIDVVSTGPKAYCIAPSYVVQFGAGGPFCRLQHGSVRKASLEEIAEKNGCRILDLPEACR